MASSRRIELEAAGREVLNASRTELYIAMRFMGAALSSLSYEMDLSTTSVGTDAVNIRFNPSYVCKLFLEEPGKLNRTYLHMILHCIFRHMYTSARYTDVQIYDLCADIVVESILDGMDYQCIYRVSSDYRDRWYSQLEKELKVLTVEKLYKYFKDNEETIDIFEIEKLEREFKLDDHGFWQRLPDDPPENDDSENEQKKHINPIILKQIQDKEKDWDKEAKRLQTEIETIGKNASDRLGKLSWILKFHNTSRTDYKEFLQRFMVIREEGGIDMDTFDYGMYAFGLDHYGNMPLIEENEFREVKKIQELVIAIDTSASCKDELVQRFLNETAAILLNKDNFFQRIRIHVLQCDDQIQKDDVIESVDDMRRYSEEIHVEGGYGTDFRPVFEKVESLRSSGDIGNLKGLIYFTDGYGVYPDRPTDYDTAFLFPKDGDYNDEKVPAWALKLYV
ncbi:Predicted metal-dependent peptidase [Butyrivibrio hungatei DSM 14810]|uniref:Predicted metal-dependent peptidase n=1 Tax=Butyrivibrio hungatei DSM 14810 TaxID=1121132 RepID=A0A1M7RVP2_9FIRM|nr:VWA-like domain-containing protein [Butyrivibrio hungatei]SHN50280.1 Predicted metal-dependent peptidase [Butyrivibrio hungatei DSM 14810]